MIIKERLGYVCLQIFIYLEYSKYLLIIKTGVMFLITSKSLYYNTFHTGIFHTIRNKSRVVESTIMKKLQAALQTTHLEVENELSKAEQPHIRLVVVTDKFHGLPMWKRYNLINDILKEELQAGTHISSVVAKTPIQWHRSLAAKEYSSDS